MMKNKAKRTINALCENCYNNCKQYDTVLLVKCPNYKYKPYQQEFDFFKLKKARKARSKKTKDKR